MRSVFNRSFFRVSWSFLLKDLMTQILIGCWMTEKYFQEYFCSKAKENQKVVIVLLWQQRTPAKPFSSFIWTLKLVAFKNDSRLLM